MRAAFSLLALLLLPAVAAPFAARAQTATLRGFVTDSTSGQTLPDAAVILTDPAGGDLRGAATNGDGYYQISRIPAGRYVLRATYVGFRAFTDTLVFAADELRTLNITLSPTEEELGEVIVESEGGPGELEAGLQTIRPSDLARVPTPDVSGDLASYLQALPGIIALGDRGGQLFIRGGTPDQNLVLMDGMLVYQPFHIIGFFSAFSEDLINYADVYAGGYGARYTSRISSVIDVSMRNGNKQRFAGAVSAAPFLASVRLEGPLWKDRVSFIASVRESVIERIAPVIAEDPLSFRFGDQFAKLHASLGRNNRLSITALHTYDRGLIDPEKTELTENDAVRWENFSLGIRHLILPENFPIFAELMFSTSRVDNVVGSTIRPERKSWAQRFNTEAHVTHFLGETKINWGMYARTLLLEYSLGGFFQDLEFDRASLVEAGLYIDADLKINDELRVNPSIAAQSFATTFNASLEPRLRVVYRPGGAEGRHQLSAAWGLYAQTISGISDERDAGSVFVAWLPPPFARGEARAMHSILGWQMRARPWLRLTAEGYYKDLADLPVPIWSALARFTTTLTQADGSVYGLDTRVEVQRPNFYGYVGYGLATVTYDAAQDNFGVWYGEPVQSYHPPHDRRHQLNALASLDIGGFQASLRWQFGSGLPYTRPIAFDDWLPLRKPIDVRDVPGEQRLIYERPYQGRLPTYHRLDFSIERTFETPGSEMTLQAGAINVYDRRNLFYFDVFTVRRVDQLPLVPFVGLKIEVK